MNKVPIKEDIERIYKSGATIKDVSEQLGFSVGCIHKYMCKYEIKRRCRSDYPNKPLSEEIRKRISDSQKGKKLSQETKRKMSEAKKQSGIGHKKTRTDGYVYVYFPDHPMSNRNGYIMEHILVMECAIGRWIADNEVVHHINHNRSDNRLSNLKLMNKKEHMSMHAKERHLKKDIPHYTKPVKDITTGKAYSSVTEAAKAIGAATTNVCAVCRGNKKSLYGHVFEYIEEV